MAANEWKIGEFSCKLSITNNEYVHTFFAGYNSYMCFEVSKILFILTQLPYTSNFDISLCTCFRIVN